MSRRSDLRSTTAVGATVRVEKSIEWVCPKCRTVNDEVGDIVRVRVVCGSCGHSTYLKGETK